MRQCQSLVSTRGAETGFFSRKKKKEKTITVAIEASGTLIDKDGWFYSESQNPSDSPYTIRIDQRTPWSLRSGPFRTQKIAGLNHPSNIQSTFQFFTGRYRWLDLEKEPDNEFDGNAIKVMGRFTDASNKEQKVKLGYLRKETAQRMAGWDISIYCPIIYYIQYPNPEQPSPSFKVGFHIQDYSKSWLKKNRPEIYTNLKMIYSTQVGEDN